MALEHLERLKARLSVAFATVGLILALGSVTYTSTKALSTTAVIQQSRIDACRDINQRHKASVKVLDQLLAQNAPAHPTNEQKAKMRKSRAQTVVFINALVPLRNCEEVVK